MERLAVFEFAYVVVAAATGVVWHVDSHSPVYAQDEELQVVAHSDAGAYRHLLEQVLHLELCPLAVSVVAHSPHVAGIEEGGAIEVSEEIETVFQIGDKLHVAGLVEV